MDYEFSVDEYDRPIAEFSLGHEAIGRWLTEELCDQLQVVDELLTLIQQIELRQIPSHKHTGTLFELQISEDEVEVTALSLKNEMSEELPENTRLYDDEHYAECGLKDFKHAVQAWKAFI